MEIRRLTEGDREALVTMRLPAFVQDHLVATATRKPSRLLPTSDPA